MSQFTQAGQVSKVGGTSSSGTGNGMLGSSGSTVAMGKSSPFGNEFGGNALTWDSTNFGTGIILS